MKDPKNIKQNTQDSTVAVPPARVEMVQNAVDAKPDHPIPAVSVAQALQSLRDSGYDFSAALGEPIDNSIESGASRIQVRLEESKNRRGKKHVHRIAIADDGEGMNPSLLQRYLVLGFSTRFMRKDTIGKYGVGAKLAALNFVQRVDAWSRTSKDEPWRHAYFDLEEEIAAHEEAVKKGLSHQAMVNPPDEAPVPVELEDLLPDGSGTLVVWSKSDRLEEGRLAENFDQLRIEVEKELARMFRYFIDGGIEIIINGTKLIPYDPLFLMEGHWGDFVLNHEHGNTGKDRKHYAPTLMKEKAIQIGSGKATIRVTVYPEEVVRQRGLGGDTLAKKLRLPDTQGYISFVRLDREVAYTKPLKIFPTAVKEADRHIGIEVSFTPELDDYFGVRNVKRGVEPHGELRNKIRKALAGPIDEARKLRNAIWDQRSEEELDEDAELDPIEDAVKDADRVMPKGRAKGDEHTDDEAALRDLAEDKFGQDEEAKKKYVDEIKEKELPFVIESVSWPGQNFIEVIHTENRTIIRLNTRHRFYREMYEPLKKLAALDLEAISPEDAKRTSRRSIEALTLMIIAYGKAESMHEIPEEQYGDLRMYWGQFLHTLMGKVRNVL